MAYGQLKLDSISNWSYRSYLIPWLIGIPLEVLSGFYVLKVIMDSAGDIAGWNFPQVAFLYAIGLLCHGVDDLLFIQGRGIDRGIIRGEFDRMLLRPLGVFFQFATGAFNWCGFFTIIPGIAVLGYACSLLELRVTLALCLFVLVVTAAGSVIRGSILYLIGSIAFWTKKSSSLVVLDLTLKQRVSIYPLTIFPKWLQVLFTFVLPLGFINFYPVSGLLKAPIGLHLPLPLDLMIWSPIVAAILFWLARGLFGYALRRKYESAGS